MYKNKIKTTDKKIKIFFQSEGESDLSTDDAKYVKAEQPTIQRRGGVVGRGVESVQHLFTPGGEAVLRLHALQQLQQLLLLISPLTTHHVLITAEDT